MHLCDWYFCLMRSYLVTAPDPDPGTENDIVLDRWCSFLKSRGMT